MEIPSEYNDPINSQILSISEDCISGFHPYPFSKIAQDSGVSEGEVLLRIRTMLEAKVIRRVRQTFLANKLSHGALVAWICEEKELNKAFDFMAREDPFSGHVVIRSTDIALPASKYRLWTTLKVPLGESLEEHANVLLEQTPAQSYILMPAKGIFTLGVGHVRRKVLKFGEKSEKPAKMMTTKPLILNNKEWTVLISLKEELKREEIVSDIWERRAESIGLTFSDFCQISKSLEEKKVLGRFSTFLEHVKPSASGEKVTRFNALFHWAVPKGMEEIAGGEVGKHHCMTHCYWREAGEDFGNVNIMGVIHGTEKQTVLSHKEAIDRHLEKENIPVSYTNVFWGGRSEIKPSEISPEIYRTWHKQFSERK